MAFDEPSVRDVRLVFDTSLSDSVLAAFTEDAHAVVDGLLTGKGLSADRLTRITKYLTCGFAELRDPRATEQRAAGQTVKYLQNSYIDRAVQMDPTGTLRKHFAGDDGDRVQLVSMTRAGPQDADPEVTSDDYDELDT